MTVSIRRNKLYAFTLFEMLIVMAIVALAVGAVSFYLPKALKKERFEKGVSQIISKISLAQEVMLDYRIDVTLTLQERDGGGIDAWIEPALETSEILKKSLNLHPTIEGIEELSRNGVKVEKIVLPFEGRTGATWQGVLGLFSKQNATALVLKGFPSKIEQKAGTIYEIQAPYPEEIVSAI